MDKAVGLAWAPGGHPRVVFRLTIVGEKIVVIALLADPESLREINLKMLTG